MNISLKFRHIIVCLTIMATSSLLSCSDNESYDVMGDPANKVFINTQQWTPINSPKNAFSFSVVHTPVGDFGDVQAKFPVRSTRPVNESVTIKVELDNSLVDSYNKANGTAYAKLPDGILNMSKNSVIIEKGSYLSADSVQLSIDNSKLAQLTEKAYLAPVKLMSVAGDDCEISSDYNTAYVLITTSVNLIKANVGSTDMTGSLVSDYSAWTVTTDVTPSKGSYSSIFDGSTSTNWRFPSTPVTMTIDMKEVKKISGFKLFSQYGQYGYTFSQVKISLSKDNVSYDEIGTCSESKMNNEGGYQYICFYGGMEAQYIKLTLNWKYSWYPYICELGVYTK